MTAPARPGNARLSAGRLDPLSLRERGDREVACPPQAGGEGSLGYGGPSARTANSRRGFDSYCYSSGRRMTTGIVRSVSSS